MKKLTVVLFTIVSFMGACTMNARNGENIPLPSNAQLCWQQYEQIMFLHFDPATWQGTRRDDSCSYPLSKINPRELNTDQWCEVAKSWNAKLIIFTVKHGGGFCWWQTNTSEYGIKNTPWKNGRGDVLRELSKSCKKYGLNLGLYIAASNVYQWGAGFGKGGITRDSSKQEGYNKIYRRQLTEVLTQYGPIKEIWFDGGCRIPVNDILEKYASNAIIFQGEKANIRWLGNENGICPYPNWYTVNKKDLATGKATAVHSDVNGDAYAPVEVDVPLLNNHGHKWFWGPKTDHMMLSIKQLMNLYYNSVGRGYVLLLNATPDTTGLIPESHVRRYAEFGKEIMNRFKHPVKQISGKGQELVMDLKQVTRINHCILQERLEKGQRITSYIIEGEDEQGNWKILCQGTSVGNKKIDYFKNSRVKRVRLRVLSSKATPYIRDFSVYDVQSDPGEATSMH